MTTTTERLLRVAHVGAAPTGSEVKDLMLLFGRDDAARNSVRSAEREVYGARAPAPGRPKLWATFAYARIASVRASFDPDGDGPFTVY